MPKADLDNVLTRLSRRAVAAGDLQDTESFTLDHFYHLLSLAPISDPAIQASESLGEKAVLSTRRFGQGGVLVQVLDHDGEITDVLRKAFEDQSGWSRELTALMKAVNEEYSLGHKIDFIDVLETNPVVRTQTYVGQLQEAIVERVGIAAAVKVGRARRKDFLYDAGALVALGIDQPGKQGAYRRLSDFLISLGDLHAGLTHYYELLGQSKPVRIGGKDFYFPQHLLEDPAFTAVLAEWNTALKDAGKASTLDPGQMSRNVRQRMTKTPGMSEAEAIQAVADTAKKEIVALEKRMGSIVNEKINDVFTEANKVVSRHADTLNPELEGQMVRAAIQAVADAEDEMTRLGQEYLSRATGQTVKPSARNLDATQFSQIVEDAVRSNDPAQLQALADLRKAHAAELPKHHPTRIKVETEAAIFEEAARIQKIMRGEAPRPEASPVKIIWSGFQNGVDQHAIRTAMGIEGLGTGGYAPTGILTSEGAYVQGVMADAAAAGVIEVPADAIPGRVLTSKERSGYAARSAANIEATDATIVVYPEAGTPGMFGHEASSGSPKTIGYAMRGPRGEGVGFNTDYTVADFLADFEEIPEAPGMWRVKPGKQPHKPIIVVSYQETVGAKVIAGRQAMNERELVADRQQRYVQQWLRDHNVEKLNMAGSRTRKGRGNAQPGHLLPEYRYGRQLRTIMD
ncbi:MAG: putative molybdenum carrier protein, partial [Actinomycetia bacterium]|nr:putative molybdenum carrier protein [Actinomycetes bacterium]